MDGASVLRAANLRDLEHLEQLQDWRWTWREACTGAGLCYNVDTVTGITVSTPKVLSCTINPPSLTVRLLPGQLPRDVMAVAHRLSPAMGVPRLRVVPLQLQIVRVELLRSDPLQGVVRL